jgi:hypothetical protein
MTTKRAEDLCEGDVILSGNAHWTVDEATHPFHDTVRVTVRTNKGRVFTFYPVTGREFVIVEYQLWTALYTHEYGNDSYLFLVESTDDITLPIDEVKVAQLLGLQFDANTEVVHSARLINYSVANPTDIRDPKGRPLPIYKD